MRPGVPSLRIRRYVQELRRSFARACERGDFRLVHYSIQGDHLHLIVEAEHHRALACGMKAIGSRVARAVQRVFAWSGKVLLGRYHAQMLTSLRQVRNAIRYVLQNARKHAAARARRWKAAWPERADWTIDPASSGEGFDGWREHVERAAGGLEAARRRAGVAAARSFGLAKGWRRHGLISVLEVPGGRRAAGLATKATDPIRRPPPVLARRRSTRPLRLRACASEPGRSLAAHGPACPPRAPAQPPPLPQPDQTLRDRLQSPRSTGPPGASACPFPSPPGPPGSPRSSVRPRPHDVSRRVSTSSARSGRRSRSCTGSPRASGRAGRR